MSTQIDRIAKLMALAGGMVLCAVVALTFYDVLLRYLFSDPLRGRQDVVEMGMVTALMLAAPYTWRTAGHIAVDLYDAIPFWPLEVARTVLIKVLVAGVLALIAWRAIEAAEDAALFSEATNMILIPHRPFIFLIMGVSAVHALILIYETITDVIVHFNNRRKTKDRLT